MAEAVRLEFDRCPSSLPAYGRAFLGRRPARLAEGRSIPRIEASLSDVRVDPDQLSEYAEVCGFPHAESLPATFPHILAMPLHIRILTHGNFPLRPLGLIHIRNSITQYRDIAAREALAIECWVDGHRDTEKGNEFDMMTRVRVGEEVVWEEASTFLSRGPRRRKGARGSENLAACPREVCRVTSWAVDPDIGRRYAAVSGDYNPIHLFRASAKLFGFPNAIAHGMWSLARCVAEMGECVPNYPRRVDCEFKGPILLPAWVILEHCTACGSREFELCDSRTERLHIVGRVVPLEE